MSDCASCTRMVLGAVAGLLIGTSPAQSQTAGQKSAYEYALRCWGVAGYLITDPEVKANPEAAARVEAGAQRVYNAALRMGAVLGYSQARIDEDLDLAGRVEGALMLRDRSYFERSKAACDQLGLS